MGRTVVLLLASTLGVMGGAIVVPVLEVIRGDLGVSGTAGGFVLTAHGLAIAVVSPVVGRVVDRFGVRAPMVAGLVVYGLGGGAGLVVESYPALIAARLVFGVGAAAVFTCTTVGLLAFYDGAMRDQVMGWRSTATSAGGVVWPLLGGLLGGLSWHATFAIYLVGLPLAVAAALALPAGTGGAPARRERAGVGRLLRERPALLGYYALWLVFAVQGYVLAIFLPARLAELGIDDPLVVSIYAVAGGALATSVVGLLYARIRRWATHRVLLATALSCTAAGFGLYATVSQPVVLLAAPVLFGVGNGVLFPVVTVLVDEVAGPELRGRAAALSGTVIFAGQFASPLLFGPLIEATSTTTGFAVAGGTSVSVLCLVVWAWWRRSTPDQVRTGAGTGEPGHPIVRSTTGTAVAAGEETSRCPS
ncbi:hypothetical protein B1813_15395 [Saccharomonospora piscinae]|uniref:Major facilitator superfamily (MFS) profile domain-containing protein n=1 Tax=Saccharomonospora piscinae TaxID=687388 RepID=A0A1V9A185_SACPI|nr:MFS transporter [Saccharomonospora piscinae]OQO90899.1 hypothetical protein B1813_15395 [Saccharomonospora piscinae]